MKVTKELLRECDTMWENGQAVLAYQKLRDAVLGITRVQKVPPCAYPDPDEEDEIYERVSPDEEQQMEAEDRANIASECPF